METRRQLYDGSHTQNLGRKDEERASSRLADCVIPLTYFQAVDSDLVVACDVRSIFEVFTD